MTQPATTSMTRNRGKFRPALRYRGGKAVMGPEIIAHFPPHECYVEPFAGGASVLLQKERADFECLNDIDGEVMNFWRMLRDYSEELMQMIEMTPWSRAEFELAFEPNIDPLERARRFYVRCWQGRANTHERSGWRFQYAWYGWRTNKPEDFKQLAHVEAIAGRLAHVQLECREATEVIEMWGKKPGTLIYCDPPYAHATRARSRKLYTHEMTDRQHRELAEALHGIKGMAIVSGYDCELYRELYRGWQMEMIATSGEAGKRTTECLWISPNAAGAHRQLTMIGEG